MTPTREQQIEAAAMKYAKVDFEGLNKLGQKMYSAENLKDLEYREIRMAAYNQGWQAADANPSSELIEILRCFECMVKGFKDGIATVPGSFIGQDSIKEWDKYQESKK